jgi:hypothetical protein
MAVRNDSHSLSTPDTASQMHPFLLVLSRRLVQGRRSLRWTDVGLSRQIKITMAMVTWIILRSNHAVCRTHYAPTPNPASGLFHWIKRWTYDNKLTAFDWCSFLERHLDSRSSQGFGSKFSHSRAYRSPVIELGPLISVPVLLCKCG